MYSDPLRGSPLHDAPDGAVVGLAQREHWVDVEEVRDGWHALRITTRVGDLTAWVRAEDLLEGVDEHRGADCRLRRHLPELD